MRPSIDAMLIGLGGAFFVASVVFWLWAIFDSLTADPARVRTCPKWAWVIAVVLFLEFGALAWLLFGRPRAQAGDIGKAEQPRNGYRFKGGLGAAGFGGPRFSSRAGSAGRRPVGPDDDPDFLRSLS